MRRDVIIGFMVSILIHGGTLYGDKLINFKVNRGKGAAMKAGVAATDADILVFLDADLIGLRPEHVEDLVAPVKSRRYEMAVGSFRGGRYLTDLAQRVTPNISGQRAIRRGTFEQIPGLEHSRYGVEIAITRFCRLFRVKTQIVLISGVTHPMKEQKLGYMRGLLSRGKMYTQIIKILLDPRKPKRVRPRLSAKSLPHLLRKLVSTERKPQRNNTAAMWLYRTERKWHKRREDFKVNVKRKRRLP
ncbi:MAG: glycosyltransferase [Chthonomonadales bacterium]